MPEQSFRTLVGFVFAISPCFWTCWSNSWVSEHPNLQISLLTQHLHPGVEHLNYSAGGTDGGRGMGLRSWSEDHQVLMRLYDLPALLLCLRPALPHVADLRSPASSGSPRRAPHQEVSQLDGPQGSGNGLVPGGGVMRGGCSGPNKVSEWCECFGSQQRDGR